MGLYKIFWIVFFLLTFYLYGFMENLLDSFLFAYFFFFKRKSKSRPPARPQTKNTVSSILHRTNDCARGTTYLTVKNGLLYPPVIRKDATITRSTRRTYWQNSCVQLAAPKCSSREIILRGSHLSALSVSDISRYFSSSSLLYIL